MKSSDGQLITIRKFVCLLVNHEHMLKSLINGVHTPATLWPNHAIKGINESCNDDTNIA